jgi:hypothetical protein
LWRGQKRAETSRNCLIFFGYVWTVVSLLFLFCLCSVSARPPLCLSNSFIIPDDNGRPEDSRLAFFIYLY